MSRIGAMRRNVFLRALVRHGVTVEEARGGGSLVKLRYGTNYSSFHVHPSEAVGPPLISKVLRQLGIDYDAFGASL